MAVKARTGFVIPDNLEYFDSSTLNDVETLAATLSPEEVMQWFGLEYNEGFKNTVDHTYFLKFYNKGRIDGVRKAGNALFESMKNSKTGKDSSICYLLRFASRFEGIDDAKKQASGETFAFRVVLD